VTKEDRFVLFIVLSVLLHLIFLLGLMRAPVRKAALSSELEVTLRPYQIADIEPPEKEQRPERARFLGMYDSTVDRETVAPSRSEDGMRVLSGGGPGPREARPGLHPLPPAATKSRDGATFAAKQPRSDLPFGPTEDFYPDYKMGDHTYLNVLRFPQVAYFVRLKKAFKTTFNPVPSLRGYALTNQISRGQVEVVLGVTVDRSGNLAELLVLNSSGLPSYDREALRTVRDSSPFTTPPTALLAPDGRLRMSWTFTVYL